jgi:hypothetical protein
MKRFAGGTSIILVVSLIVLLVSLAALLLANSLRGQLEEAQGQLQDTQSELQKMQEAQDRQQKTDSKGGAGAAGREPGPVNKSLPQNAKDQSQNNTKGSTQEGQDQQRAIMLGIQGDGGSLLPSLLLLALGLMVLASLVLVVISALTLLFGGSRSGRSGAGSEALTLSHTGTSNLGDASPPEDRDWMKLVEECVEVVDELDEHMGSFDAPRREVAGHVILRLEEILGRSGVDVISNDAIFDRARHKPDADHTATDNGAAVYDTMSPGFAIGSRVLRRARVQLE